MIEEDPATVEHPHARWWRRRHWRALTVALAVAALAGGVATWARGGGEDLPRSSPTTSYIFYQMEPRTEFAVGNLRIFENGKTVQIVSAKALTSPNVEQLGSYAVWPRDYVPPGVGKGYPLPDQKVRHELREPVPAAETGYVAPRRDESPPLLVTMGFRILSGMGAVNGIHITYKANGKTKQQYFPFAVIGCVKPLNCEDGALTENDKALRELGLVREQ